MSAPLVLLSATLTQPAPELSPLTFVTESGASFAPALPPPGDWLVLSEGRTLGPRRFARAVHDRPLRRELQRADRGAGLTCAGFVALGATPAVLSLVRTEPLPGESLLVPSGLAFSALSAVVGAWFLEVTSGPGALRRQYALDEAQALAVGEPSSFRGTASPNP